MKLDKVKPARRKSGWISKLFERLLIAINYAFELLLFTIIIQKSNNDLPLKFFNVNTNCLP